MRFYVICLFIIYIKCNAEYITNNENFNKTRYANKLNKYLDIYNLKTDDQYRKISDNIRDWDENEIYSKNGYNFDKIKQRNRRARSVNGNLPNITFLYNGENIELAFEPIIYMENKFFVRIVVENNIFDIKNVICQAKYYNNIYIQTNQFKNSHNNVFDSEAIKLQSNLVKDWYCLFSTENREVNNTFAVRTRFRAEYVQNTVSVNGNKLKTHSVDLNIKDYDYFAKYYFIDGELVKIKYHQGSFNWVAVQYNNDTIDVDKVIYLKLSENMASKYIDFKLTQTVKGESILRLYFEPADKERGNSPYFIVNGLPLRTSGDQFIYRYILHERIEAKVLFNNKYNNVTCKSNYTIKQSFTPRSVDIKIVKTFTKDDDGAEIVCNLEGIDNNSSTIKLKFKMKKYNENETLDPEIDVSYSKIIAQYKLYNQKVNKIKYNYENDQNHEPHFFTCNSSTVVHWIYSGRQVESFHDTLYCPVDTRKCTQGFRLIENYKVSSITCVSDSKETRLELRRQEIIIREGEALPTNMHNIIYLGSGVSLIVIIIIITIFIILCVKNKKIEPVTTEVNYENLPAHNEGPMLEPNQWATYSNPVDIIQNDTYTLPSNNIIDTLYSKPIPKSERNKNVSPYAEIKKNESPYAEVGDSRGNNGYAFSKDIYEEPAYTAVRK